MAFRRVKLYYRRAAKTAAARASPVAELKRPAALPVLAGALVLAVEAGWLDDPVAPEAAVTVEMPVIVVVLLQVRGTMSVDETRVTSAHCNEILFQVRAFQGERAEFEQRPTW